MQEPSFSSSSIEPTESTGTVALPENFIIALEPEVFRSVALMAMRHAADPIGSRTFTVEFLPNSRLWRFEEQNVTSWYHESDVEGPESGLLTVSVYFFEAVRQNLVEDSDDFWVELLVDLTARTITYRANDCEFSASLPDQRLNPFPAVAERTSRVIVQAPHIAQIGPFLSAIPVSLPDHEDGHTSVFLPFINFTYDGVRLTISRDWSQFDGPVLTLTVPAGGDYRGTFSMLAPLVAREIYFADLYSQGPLTFEFSDTSPHVCHIATRQWGMSVVMAHQHVFEHRHKLHIALTAGIEGLLFHTDERIGWDPIVVFTAGERSVTATITEGEKNRGRYVRVNTDIVSDLPWSPELATEINAWNDQWPAIKLLHKDGVLRAIADVPVAAIPGISAVVLDLVEKAQIVDDLIAAVL